MTANANSTRRRRTMRTRLVWSLVLVATAGILIAGVITVLAVQHGAEHSAQSNIEHKAANIVNDVKEVQGQAASGSAAPALRLRDLLDQVRSAVQVSDAHLVFVRADGGVATYNQVLSTTAGRRLIGNDSEASDLVALPKGVSADDLALDQVARGSTTTTLRQNGNVYLAERVPSLTRTRATPVIIVSDVVDTGAARRAATAFIIAALIALAACVVVSTLLARRLTKPLTAIDTAARALAAGDLTARVDLGRRTDRETAEVAATLNQMASDLDGARRAERSFLQAVSHDLRTPLTSIRGYAEALADGTVDATDDQARVRAAEVITTESRRLERLVRDLLDLSRLDAHEFSLRPQPCDAAALAATTVAGFAPQAQSLGVELQAPDAGAVPADLDPERFGQIIANLVENALKYARSRVAVTFGASERDVTVTVADNGAGIPDAEQARVFERLYTARSAPGRPVGTGLGLTVVHELARAMGGGARLVSSGTDGTVFSVTVARGSTGVV